MTDSPDTAVSPAREPGVDSVAQDSSPSSSIDVTACLPLSLDGVQTSMLVDLPLHLVTEDVQGLVPFRPSGLRFRETDRQALLSEGRELVYVPLDRERQFRRQVEAALSALSTDEMHDQRARIYRASATGLVTHTIAEFRPNPSLRRIREVTESAAALVMSDQDAIRYLLAYATYDLQLAVHVVRVAARLVGLAYASGERDPDRLCDMFSAGLVHDIGRTRLPESQVPRSGPLSPDQKKLVERHAELGDEYLANVPSVPEVARVAALQHHERLDGSGYPRGLSAEEVVPAARMCAIVDAYDVLTSITPHRAERLSPVDAVAELEKEAPAKLDGEYLALWKRLVTEDEDASKAESEQDPAEPEQRHSLRARGVLQVLDGFGRSRHGYRPQTVALLDLSRSGVRCVSREALIPGSRVKLVIHIEAWKNRWLDGEVARCRRVRDGTFDVGIAVQRIHTLADAAR